MTILEIIKKKIKRTPSKTVAFSSSVYPIIWETNNGPVKLSKVLRKASIWVCQINTLKLSYWAHKKEYLLWRFLLQAEMKLLEIWPHSSFFLKSQCIVCWKCSSFPFYEQSIWVEIYNNLHEWCLKPNGKTFYWEYWHQDI